ncbi:hypothetical protein TPR58_11940 [Sphingomonas sp. HF-S3]|jgi:hypothetical protein|uniref:Uncharacterized protein n=1 Tax=Sphingomonas rustica TaxID=3103142 RepID=A0ABV0BBC9_9SPHN
MPDKPTIRNWGKTVLVLAAALSAAVSLGMQESGMTLAMQRGGVSVELRAAFVTLAFDIGRNCPEADTKADA